MYSLSRLKPSQALAFFLVLLLLLHNSYFVIPDSVSAADSPWTQTDWSGGSGQTVWSDATKFSSSSNLDTSGTSGEVTVSKIEKLSNTGFETDLTSWNTYNSVVSSLSPLAWWKMQEGNGGTADINSIANSGSLANVNGAAVGTPNGATGPSSAIPYAVNFNGTDERFDIPNEASFDFERTDPFTMLIWIKTTVAGNVDATFIGKGFAPGYWIRFFAYSNDGALQYGLVNAWAGNGAFYQSTVNLNNDKWHMITGVNDGTGAVAGMTFYLDGSTANTGALSNVLSSSILNNTVLQIGADSSTRYFPGQITQVAIFNKVLTAQEIANLSLLGFSSTTRDTGITYSSTTGAAKIVASADGAGGHTQSVNVGDTSTYALEAYAYTTGAAVTSADVELYYNGATISTTYTSAGGGWYKLSGTLTGANETRDFGVQVKAGKTVYVDNFSLYRYQPTGSVTSSIFDSNTNGSFWGALTWTDTSPTNTSVSVKVRTSNNSDMSGATAFSSCTAISNSGDDISSNSCVTDGERYVQYEVTLSSTDGISTPTFNDISLAFSVYLPTAPSSFTGSANSTHGTSRIDWSFTDNASSENGFYVKDSDGNTVCTVSSASSGTGSTVTCTETGLTPNTSYTRYAVAYGDGGNSTATSTATVTTRVVPEPVLDLPKASAYVNTARPSFRFKTPSNNTTTRKFTDVDTYTLTVEDANNNTVFTISGIPKDAASANKPSENVHRISTYEAVYEGFSDTDNTNNYITVTTKSSSNWPASSVYDGTNGKDKSNDGQLVEGVNTWRVRSVDIAGNTATKHRTVNYDRGKPTLANVEIQGTRQQAVGSSGEVTHYTTNLTPTITATAKDTTQLKQLVITTERVNYFLGVVTSYTPVSTTTLTLSGTEADISHILGRGLKPANTGLSLGAYKITLTLYDSTNQTTTSILNLNIVDEDTLRELFDISAEQLDTAAKDLSVDNLAKQALIRKQKEAENLNIAIDKLVPKPAQEFVADTFSAVANTLSNTAFTALRRINSAAAPVLAQFISPVSVFAEAVVDKANSVYQESIPEPIQTSITQLVAASDKLTQPLSQGIITAQKKRPKKAAQEIANTFAPVTKRVQRVAYVTAMAVDEYFNTEPPVITDVVVEEVGRDYAVVSWKSNHYSTGKLNYGLDPGAWYKDKGGGSVFSSRMTKHHKVKMTNLKPDTKYYFEVMAQNGGYVYDAYYFFDTEE